MARSKLGPRTARIAVTVLAVWATAHPAKAGSWQVSGPERPAAGEAATYVVRGPSGVDYDIVVNTGAGGCAQDLVAGDPAQTLARHGFLNSNGVDSQQLSFDAGLSTIGVYDNATESIVDSKRIRTTRGRDRLRISVANTANSDAYATATGYVGREGDPFSTDTVHQHNGTVLITARPPRSRCPRAAPSPFAPRTASQEISTARFSVDLTIIDALTVSPTPRLCGYLTAERRHAGSIRDRTVATASVEVDDDTFLTGRDSGNMALITAALLLTIGSIAGVSVLLRRRGAPPQTPPTVAASGGPGDPGVVARPPVSNAPAVLWPAPRNLVQHHGDEEASFEIQRAAAATAAVFRDRLHSVLHAQDGEGWLEAFNQRRRSDMLGKGHRAPRTYDTFEPRAVLNCLAYDPAALQLIDNNAAAAARQLSGLANAAHHPDPDNPLTDSDAERAWRLYTQITGKVHRPTRGSPD
jgi:hypothetical protein